MKFCSSSFICSKKEKLFTFILLTLQIKFLNKWSSIYLYKLLDKNINYYYDISIKVTLRLLGQEVKTPPSHGGIRGSIPLGVTIMIRYINLVQCVRS